MTIRLRIFPELNGLKGLAGLLVILFHVTGGLLLVEKYDASPIFHYLIGPLLMSGWFAVDIFFVLSAFFITYRYVDDHGSKQEWLMRRYSKFFPYIWLGVIPNFILSFIAPNIGLLGYILIICVSAVFIRVARKQSIIEKYTKSIFYLFLGLQLIWICVTIFDGRFNYSSNTTFHVVDSFFINFLVIQPFSQHGQPVIFWTMFPLLSFYYVFIFVLRPLREKLRRLNLRWIIFVNVCVITTLLTISFLLQDSYFNLRFNQFFRQYCLFVGFQLALYWNRIAHNYNRVRSECLVLSSLLLYLLMLWLYVGVSATIFIFISILSAILAACVILHALEYNRLRSILNAKWIRFVGAQAYGIFLFQSFVFNFMKEYIKKVTYIPEDILIIAVPVMTCLISWVALRIVDTKV